MLSEQRYVGTISSSVKEIKDISNKIAWKEFCFRKWKRRKNIELKNNKYKMKSTENESAKNIRGLLHKRELNLN